MKEPISFGGGVNSVAMTIMLVNKGWHGDIVFADTGAEWPETYCYMDYFEREWLQPRGLSITRLGAEYRKGKVPRNVPGLIEYCEHYRLTPFAAFRWCTRIFKAEPCKAFCGDVPMLIGIAADESRRQKGALRPLVDAGITRQGCIEIIRAEGLDVPRKSGCYICPLQPDYQWYELWRKHPELIERAARLEEIATERVKASGKARKRMAVTLDPNGKVTVRQRIYAYEHPEEFPDFPRERKVR